MISLIRQAVSVCDVSDNNDLSESVCYEFAGQRLVSAEEIHSLAAFKIEQERCDNDQCRVLQLAFSSMHAGIVVLNSTNSVLHYRGDAQFNNKLRDTCYWRQGSLAQVDVDGVPVCRIDLQSQQIVILNSQSFDESLNLEIITGPALIILLAQLGVFCLHAGAVAFSLPNGRDINCAFIADSGVGKSTLSKHLGDAWAQIADDILPVNNDRAMLMSLSDDFPQLKLANARVSCNRLKTNALNCVVCLNPLPSDDILIKPMNQIDALLAVVRHTVAAKIFDSDVATQHLEFAKNLAQTASVLSVSYPRDLSQLPRLRQSITDCLTRL